MTTKEKVLQELIDKKGQTVSGEYLAQLCNVSRAAIWKAVNALREENCQIEGSTNGGYILNGQVDLFSKELFQKHLQKKFPEFSSIHIECFKEIDSTNSYAKRILSECSNLRDSDGSLTESGKIYNNCVIVAESQTAGRGRLGRSFVSPSKTGIYLSVIYAPKGGITKPACLTAFSAVAICRAIKELYGINPSIKWINDIFINGKKAGGILTEGFTNFETGLIESAVIGIGINIFENPKVFTGDLSNVAGSIVQGELKNSVTRCQLAAFIAGHVLQVLSEDSKSVMKEYKENSFLIGKTVEVHPVIGDLSKIYKATVMDIDEEAALIVKNEKGECLSLSSGEVSLKSKNFTD